MMIQRLPMDSFDWLRWLYGIDIWILLGISPRYYDIKENKFILKAYAIGYIEADKLLCRPKQGEYAIMFLINDNFVWTHITNKEFKEVFQCD